jgi:hypothetical protein
MLLGVALRTWAYASNTSLWLDEVLLSRNITELSLRELLTQPLHLDQVAPRGFLLVERLAVTLFGQSELALRLFPFLCALAGLFLFRRLAERTLDGLAVPFAIALFAIGLPFIKYSAEVKQYGIDATAAIALTLLALDIRERDTSVARLLLVGAAGFVVIWFSQASVLVMAGIGVAFAVDWLISRDRLTWLALFMIIPMWAVASVIAVVVGVHSMTPSTRQFMDDFWEQGFLPLPLKSVMDLRWFWDRLLSLFTSPNLLHYRWPALFLVVALLGLVALWRTRRVVALVLTGPVVVAFAAAAAQQYPFRDRLVMCLMPCVLLTVAAGAEWIRRVASRLHPALGGALMIALIAPPALAVIRTPPPYDIEHTREVLSYLQQHRQPGDVVYVFPLSRIGALYYGPRYGLQPHEFITGICDRNNVRAFIRDVDRFRGVSRLWVLTSGARPFRVARASVREYLGTIGVKRDSLSLPSLTWGTAVIELYDLSDAARLSAANPETFPVPPMPTDPRPGCRPWSQPDSAAGAAAPRR